MVRAIVGIARELNIEVIAQGVETESQWSFLTATSPVTKVQGFYYRKAVPPQTCRRITTAWTDHPVAPHGDTGGIVLGKVVVQPHY